MVLVDMPPFWYVVEDESGDAKEDVKDGVGEEDEKH